MIQLFKSCIECGAEFVQYRKRHTFCSFACQRKCHNRKILHPVSAVCKSCGKEFTYDHRRTKDHNYCSIECYRNHISVKKIGVVCAKCGIEFIPDRNGRIYCSYACSARGRMGDRGFDSSYRGHNWNQQSKLIRSSGKCANRRCLKKSAKVVVDHIIPLKFAVKLSDGDFNKVNHTVNLICLCSSCHAKKTNLERFIYTDSLTKFASKASQVVGGFRMFAAMTLFGARWVSI